MNYFSLFSLPIRYSIDIAQLDSAYKALQRQFHPDRFSMATESEKLNAIQTTATVNAAYDTLKKPLTRAEYLLSLKGFNALSEQNTIHDTVFLTQQLELRQTLEEIRQLSDSEVELNHFSMKIAQEVDSHYLQLQQEIDSEQWKEAAIRVQKLHFLAKLKQQISRLEEQLLDL